jgi:hypothetical protein
MRMLSLAEVEVYVIPATPPAVSGASLSSSDGSSSASRCIDGVRDTNQCHTGTSTSQKQNPWLSVHLSKPAIVRGIKIWNRITPGCGSSMCQFRLANYQVWVGSNAGQYVSPATKCVDGTAPATGPGPFDVVCDSATGLHVGKYVTIVLPGSDRILNLAEVEVSIEKYLLTGAVWGDSPEIGPGAVPCPPAYYELIEHNTKCKNTGAYRLSVPALTNIDSVQGCYEKCREDPLCMAFSVDTANPWCVLCSSADSS